MTYQEKKEARIDRYRERAQRARVKGKDLQNTADKMASVIPFGQPILVGHHSEKSDRNYRKRIWNKMDKATEAQSKAEHYEKRAEAAEKNTAISSDDPESCAKLQEKIEKRQLAQDFMKTANRIVKGKLSREDKIEKLIALGITKPKAESLFVPDFGERIGFPVYELTNNSANIRRMKQRLAELQTRQGSDQETTKEQHENITLVRNIEENRIQLIFLDKPDQETRQQLKNAGFRWAPSQEAWQRHLSSQGEYAAKAVLRQIQEGTT